jgi:6-pyruvoyltetrahydropterin/6-carboxytetrahydropterin synthase
METEPQIVELSEEFYFDAAHTVPCFMNNGHKCGRRHGHTWIVNVWVRGAVDPDRRILIDYYDIHEAWRPIGEALDHTELNEIEGLEHPTTEQIAVWIWERLKPRLPMLYKLDIREGKTSRCVYLGPLTR